MSSTAKELAEAAALAALESLRAALTVEVELRERLRGARVSSPSGAALKLENDVRDAERRSNAAFTAWRKAQEAISP